MKNTERKKYFLNKKKLQNIHKQRQTDYVLYDVRVRKGIVAQISWS